MCLGFSIAMFDYPFDHGTFSSLIHCRAMSVVLPQGKSGDGVPSEIAAFSGAIGKTNQQPCHSPFFDDFEFWEAIWVCLKIWTPQKIGLIILFPFKIAIWGAVQSHFPAEPFHLSGTFWQSNMVCGQWTNPHLGR